MLIFLIATSPIWTLSLLYIYLENIGKVKNILINTKSRRVKIINDKQIIWNQSWLFNRPILLTEKNLLRNEWFIGDTNIRMKNLPNNFHDIVKKAAENQAKLEKENQYKSAIETAQNAAISIKQKGALSLAKE